MNDDQIKHMVNRFLSWKLPETFAPNSGITFERFANAGTPYEFRREPVGTNLLDAVQAEAMVRHMLEGLPGASVTGGALPPEPSEEALARMTQGIPWRNTQKVFEALRAAYAIDSRPAAKDTPHD